MRKVSTAYSMYFNKRYERTGILFEGRYKSQHLDSDRYLKYLFSYIHLNPLKLIDSNWKEKGLISIQDGQNHLDTYKFSSYVDFAEGERPEAVILTPEKFPEYFPTKESFLSEIQDWMTYWDDN